MKQLSKTPETFFRHCFVLNVCPLMYIGESGKNIAPVDLPSAARRHVQELCGHSIRQTAQLLKPHLVIGIGKYASEQASQALHGLDIKVVNILHPSPANPVANKGWAKVAECQLRDKGVMKYLIPDSVKTEVEVI